MFFLNPPVIALDHVCSQFLLSQFVLRHSRSNSKVVQNRAKFWRFCPPKFLGCGPPENLYISDHAHHMPCHMAKFRGLTFSTLEVIFADTLNFKPIFDPPSFEKNCTGDSGGALVRLGHSVTRVKIWGLSTPWCFGLPVVIWIKQAVGRCFGSSRCWLLPNRWAPL